MQYSLQPEEDFIVIFPQAFDNRKHAIGPRLVFGNLGIGLLSRDLLTFIKSRSSDLSRS